MKLKVLLVVWSSLFFVVSAQAEFGVQLPFLDDGRAYRCTQNWNGATSHQYSSTKYDLDFGMSRGTLIVAGSGGKVIAVENNCHEGNGSCGHGFGNYIKIKHYNQDHSLLYAHLQHHGVIVKVGDDVIAGQPIGFSGNTGNSSGAHLHFGLHDVDASRPGMSKPNVEIWSYDQNTHQEMWRLVNVSRNDSRAFVCAQSKKNGDPVDARGNFYEAMDINGFNFSAFQCASINNNSIYCWRGEADSTGRYHSAWCEDAYYYIKYYKNSSGYHSEELSTSGGRDMCLNYTGNVNLLAFLSGDYGVGGGFGYNDDSSTDNPWAGYAHDVGLKYVKIGKKSSGHWHGSETWTLGEIPEKRDFRIKVKRKGGQWKDTCAELWFSHNKHFTDDDLYLGTECKDLSDSKYDNKDEKSIYIKNIHLPTMEVGKNYYFFTVLKYNGGQNPSTESDHDECVKVEVVEDVEEEISPSSSGKTWNELTAEEQAAVLNIILN